MKQFFMLVVTAMMIPFALGQSATFTNNILTVPGVGVVDGDTSSFYADVELSYEGDGMFRITEAQDRSLVAIEEISVSILESFPVQVSVNVDGYKSVPCVELLEPAVTRDGNNFTVILAESQLGPADEQQTCIAVTDPFTTSISLDVLGLGAGTYNVKVNDVITDFTLEADNLPPAN